MTPDQMPSSNNASPNSPRQKIIAGAVVVVVLFLFWQVYKMFSGGSTATPPANVAQQPAIPPPPKAADLVVKPAAAPTPAEIERARVQAEMQAKYTAALNELQQLKVAQQIAEANQAIMTAKLATVTAEKDIVDVVAKAVPQAGGSFVPGLSGEQQAAKPTVPTLVVNYSVISVSQLQYKWHAVLSYGGNLYNVTVGDVLPADGSKVVSINKSGVELEKDGNRKQVSLVPII